MTVSQYNHVVPYTDLGGRGYLGVYRRSCCYYIGQYNTMLLMAQAQLCSKTCFVGLLIHSIFHGKNCTSASTRVLFFFFSKNRTNKQTNKTCFALITHLLTIRATTSWKMLISNKFKAQTLTKNPTGNYRCQLLASHALNMSCNFSQSACSIVCMCMVKIKHGLWTH